MTIRIFNDFCNQTNNDETLKVYYAKLPNGLFRKSRPYRCSCESCSGQYDFKKCPLWCDAPEDSK